MRIQPILAVSALLACGMASAQSNLPTVEVRASTLESVSVSCAKPDSVSSADVERVLSIDDPSMTPGLRRRFVSAVAAACKAGIPHILMTAGPNGTLTWKRME
ncbi:MAG TPA: hypothetical protein VLM17_10450 [Xanthomonadaceae bacterium]|nr:hypothetical protein [Xanthomonadaceae bacterium]